jgi:choline dehydrogenase-like flavoprotein
MSWDRGAVADYDAWEALGNPGWNWPNFIAAMESTENFQRLNNTPFGTEGVGYGGPIDTLINKVVPPQQDGFIPALKSLGVKENLNSLGGDNIGVMFQPSNILASNWTRSYAPTFLWTVAGPRVEVRTNVTVSKVVLEKSSNGTVTATGVLLEGGETISANKEVILSAGSVQSPQLLELSGIGQPAILSAAGIDVILNSSGVGENLQDHLRIQNSYELAPSYPSFDELRINATYAAEQLALYYANQISEWDYTGSGYAYLTWSQVLGSNGTSLIDLARKSADISNVVDAKKLEYLTSSNYSSTVPQLETIFSDGYTGAASYPANGTADYGQLYFTLISVIQHPFARGSIHINASNPSGHPIINPNYLSNPYDLQAVIEATKFNRKVAQTSALQKYWISEHDPGLNVTTEAEWEAFARNTTLSIYHPLGTCAMLPQSEGGVVDSELLVYGTSNLRVVDASLIPIQPSGHLQTMVYGIAELAAGIIGEKWKK